LIFWLGKEKNEEGDVSRSLPYVFLIYINFIKKRVEGKMEEANIEPFATSFYFGLIVCLIIGVSEILGVLVLLTLPVCLPTGNLFCLL